MDAAALARENALLKAGLVEVEAVLAEVQEVNRRLVDIVRTAQPAKFGKSSEKLSPTSSTRHSRMPNWPKACSMRHRKRPRPL